MLFVFGIFEFGFAFRSYLTVSNVVREAAREASVAGNFDNADYRVLRAVDRASAALPDGAIDLIIVFEASGPDSTPHSQCLAGISRGPAGTERCNVYVPSDLLRLETDFECKLGPPTDPDYFYCPGSRDVIVGNLDYVGIWVQMKHDYITGMFGASLTFEDQIVLKIEPQDAT